MFVILEATEWSKNPIIEVLDASFVGREKWINDAIFLMTKFDKQLDDSRTGSKANKFFREYRDNKCVPHLVITPTLPKEDLECERLFVDRQQLLERADKHEKMKFDMWLEGHELFRENGTDNEKLDEEMMEKIGFGSAKAKMRQIMLSDTACRLPEVLSALREELGRSEKELKITEDKRKFQDPKNLRLIVQQVLWHIGKRIVDYLDGDLDASMKFPECLQTLDMEITEEEDSEWCEKDMNHYTDSEDNWRDLIANFEKYPAEIHADKKFLGGKQYHRAIEFFGVMMTEALPDPFELKDFVANATGHLGGGLQRENWERAMVQVTKVCMKDVSHPGVNYLIKHVGTIFRRLFGLALNDAKLGEEFSATFKLLPKAVEKYLMIQFDEMLWSVMSGAAEKIHCSLAPMYSTVNPDIPTFIPSSDLKDKSKGNDNELEDQESLFDATIRRLKAAALKSGKEAKEILKQESYDRATMRKAFLQDERTNMINDEESEKILQRSFEYILALMRFNYYVLRFQLNHYLYEEFKIKISKFTHQVVDEADWDKLVEKNESVDHRIEDLKTLIQSLKDSLQEVQRIHLKI